MLRRLQMFDLRKSTICPKPEKGEEQMRKNLTKVTLIMAMAVLIATVPVMAQAKQHDLSTSQIATIFSSINGRQFDTPRPPAPISAMVK